LADNLYGTEAFLDKASALFGGVQVISKLRNNQKIRFRGKTMSVTTFFQRYPGVAQQLCIRGGEVVNAYVRSARVHVCAHGKKRFVIALKYEGEEEYRYLVASDMSWRSLDIAQAHTLRWLVEVFIQARIEDKQPACTVGSLRTRVQVESLIEFFTDVVWSDSPQEQLKFVAEQAQEVFRLNNSSKHMVGRDLGRLEPTPTLKYRVRDVLNAA